jgi:fructokinase
MIPQVTCVGEAIVDFISAQPQSTLADTGAFLKCAGGSAANIAVGLSKLGVRTAFAGLAGDDPFGMYLRRELRHAGVDVAGFRMDGGHRTRLAFVAHRAGGEREFEFWERDPADVHLTMKDLDRRRIVASSIVHLSSFLLLKEPARSTVIELSERLSKGPCRVSFDPNLRLSLWKSRRLARELHLRLARRSTFLRLNAEEAIFLSGKTTIPAAASKLMESGPQVVVVTRGAAGCYVRTDQIARYVPGYRVRSIDTTGCGDAFHAALLSSLLRGGEADLVRACRFANAAGALASTKNGAVASLPRRPEIVRFLNER